MENNSKNLSRKKFLSWSLGIGSLLAVPSALWARKPAESKGKTVKMLTPDGKLVEVDEKLVKAAANKKKAGNQEIFQWMQNPSKK